MDRGADILVRANAQILTAPFLRIDLDFSELRRAKPGAWPPALTEAADCRRAAVRAALLATPSFGANRAKSRPCFLPCGRGPFFPTTPRESTPQIICGSSLRCRASLAGVGHRLPVANGDPRAAVTWV